MRLLVVLAASVALLAGCGGEGDDPKTGPTSSDAPSGPPTAQTYGTVSDLKDAAVEAGYVCESWVQDDVVTLAAESGRCSEADVFATFASEGDLQEQLATDRELDDLLVESGVEVDPSLVGPNWTIKGPDVAELATTLGGTVRR